MGAEWRIVIIMTPPQSASISKGKLTVPTAKPQVLVTNDDGADSPILVPLLRELSKLAELCVVAPAAECSWTSKSMSRFEPLVLAEIECGGFPVQTLTGKPADCANIGIHNLCSAKPSLVVSGINMGVNSGLAFTLSSGTIGAAVEGFLAGVPSAAFSLELPEPAFALWRRSRRLDPALDALVAAAAVSAADITAEILRGGLPVGADMIAVNMPANTRRESPRCLTGLAKTSYGPLFTQRTAEPHFEYHSCQLQLVGDGPNSDVEALARGAIAITPLRYSLGAPISSVDRQRFERGVFTPEVAVKRGGCG